MQVQVSGEIKLKVNVYDNEGQRFGPESISLMKLQSVGPDTTDIDIKKFVSLAV